MSYVIEVSKEYLKLVKRFPLLPISSEDELDVAIEVMKDLTKPRRKLSTVERGFLHVLTSLIREYEAKHYATKSGSPRALVESLLEEHCMSQTALAAQLGIDRTNLSAFLSGRRQLSKASALKIAERFRIDIRFLLA